MVRGVAPQHESKQASPRGASGAQGSGRSAQRKPRAPETNSANHSITSSARTSSFSGKLSLISRAVRLFKINWISALVQCGCRPCARQLKRLGSLVVILGRQPGDAAPGALQPRGQAAWQPARTVEPIFPGAIAEAPKPVDRSRDNRADNRHPLATGGGSGRDRLAQSQERCRSPSQKSSRSRSRP